MIGAVVIFTLVVFCATIGQTSAQADCVPLAITNLGIGSDQILRWEVHANETCAIDHFIINVQFSWGDIEATFVTTVPNLDVSHLAPCEYWFFSISAVTDDHVTGQVRHIFTQVPMAPDTDLSLNIINVTRTDDYVYLQWEVENSENALCINYYRLTIVDVIANTVADRDVVSRFAYVRDLSPCSTYEFGVRAIHRALPEAEGIQTMTYYEEPGRIPPAPRLVSITHGSTSINSTWALEEYARNRCPVTAIYANGSPSFNLTIPVEDSPQRSPVTINLTPLQPSTMYLFQVSAENTAGLSTAVQFAAQTMPV